MDIPTKIENLEKSFLVMNDILQKSFNKIELLEKEIIFLKNYKKDNERNIFMSNLEEHNINQKVNLIPPFIERQHAFSN